MKTRDLSPSKLLLRFVKSNSFYSLSSLIQFVLDATILSIASIFASYARFIYQRHQDPWGATWDSVWRVIPIVILVQAIVGYVVGIYRRRWRYGSFDEVRGLITTSVLTSIVLLFLRFFDNARNPFPRSVIVMGGFGGLFLSSSVAQLSKQPQRFWFMVPAKAEFRW
jgi:FlaA1/EpsC-like NDP-sugar epimerase